MTPLEVIQGKRDGGSLSSEAITWFLQAYMRGEVTDYQMAAWLMAVYLNGMDMDETLTLTRSMRDSGKVLDLSSIPGAKIDKHSTGGVGDKTSLVIAPIVAACGVTVPMITGRALGHTGGTLDKLQSIPGFNPQPSPREILRILKKTGAVIMGQTEDLAPVDRRLYALRDVTGTVESIPLITASILSKKLAAGIDGLIMDVKTGSGAFLPEFRRSKALAESIIRVCRKMKTRIVVVISGMDQPLGRAIGNALEIQECIDFLNGNAPPDLWDLSITLCAHMIRLGGGARTGDQAARMAAEAVSSGAAARCFRDIIRLQGGDSRVMDDPTILPRAANVHVLRSPASGYVARCEARALGTASNRLGAGRNHLEDTIDPSVGIYLDKKVGDKVSKGEPLCRIHWNSEARFRDALPLIRSAYDIQPRAPRTPPLIRAVLGA